MDYLDLQGLLEMTEKRAMKVFWEFWVNQENLVLRALKEMLVILALPERLVLLDHLDLMEEQEKQDLLGRRENLVFLEVEDYVDMKEILVNLVQRDILELEVNEG